MQRLQTNGIGAILDYAAESEAEGGLSTCSSSQAAEMAAYHESNTAALLSSITSAAKVADDGAEPFVALKVSITLKAARRDRPNPRTRTPPRPPQQDHGYRDPTRTAKQRGQDVDPPRSKPR